MMKAKLIPSVYYSRWAAALLMVCAVITEAKDSRPTGEIHGHQITIAGNPVVDYV